METVIIIFLLSALLFGIMHYINEDEYYEYNGEVYSRRKEKE